MILDEENLEGLQKAIQRSPEGSGAENAEVKRGEQGRTANREIGVPAGGLRPAEPFGTRKARRDDLKRMVCTSRIQFHRLKPVPHGGKFYLWGR
jgi:hypothetical protein